MHSSSPRNARTVVVGEAPWVPMWPWFWPGAGPW